MFEISRNAMRAGFLSVWRFFSFALFSFFCLPLLCQAAVTVDAVTSQNTGANTSTTLPLSGNTWTHTVSGNNTLLIVSVSINQSNQRESVSSITFNGKAFTVIGAATRNNDVQTELWYRIAPDSGTYNVVVTLTAAARFVAGAISFNGVDQGSPLGTFAGTSGNNSSPSVTVTSEPDGLVVDVLGYANSGPTSTVGAGQTQRWAQVTTNGTASSNARGYSSTEAGATSVTMSWTISAGIKWAISAVPIVPATDKFGYRKLITIDRTKVGVTGTAATTLSNYPVLVSLTDTDLRTVGYSGHVQNSSGYDIIFRGVNDAVCGGAANNPCTLSHQIEEYVPSSGKLIAWVNLPSVNTNAASSNTTFYMYFGNSSITTSLEQATAVWNSNFQAVWHMADSAANTTVVQSTSVATPGNGVAAANTSTITATGKISRALSFNGSSDYIYQNSATSISNPQGYTLSAWIQTGTASGRKIIGFESSRTGTTSASYDRMLWIGTDGKAYAGCYGTAASTATSTNAVNDSGWHYLVAQITDTGYTLRMYVDGTLNNSTSVGAACENTTGYWRIGSYKLINWTNGSDGYYAGNIDEVRISNNIRSADWIKTDYNNQNSPSAFYSVGSLEQSPITLIELISFTATNYSGLVQLQWKTGYEVDNIGFRIYREDAGGLTRITPSMVAGSALLARDHVALTSGRTYVWQDFVESSAKSYRYWLEDVDTKGKSTWHGPVITSIGESDLPYQVQSVVLSHLGKGASKIRGNSSEWSYWSNSLQKQTPASFLTAISREFISPDRMPGHQKLSIASNRAYEPQVSAAHTNPVLEAAVKIQINKQGWYRLTQPQLVEAGLGISANPKNLQLYSDGIEQPIIVFTCGGLMRSSVAQYSTNHTRGGNMIARRACEGEFGPKDWIEFYGTGLDTLWTDTRAYWLVEGTQPGKRIATVDGSTWGSASSSLLTTIEFKPRTIYMPELLNGDDNNFFGSVISFEGDDEIFTLNHLDLLSSGNGLLQIRLQGAIKSPHIVQVQVNGAIVGSIEFEGFSAGTASFSLPSGLLLSGENHINLLAMNGEDDISVIDYLRVSYWRTLDVDEDYLPITISGNQAITVGGFTSPAIRVMDITDPLIPKEVTGTIATKDARYSITLALLDSGTRNLIAFANTSIQTPAAMEPNNRTSWDQMTDGADVVIISHADFIGRLQLLKAQHEAEGFIVALADVEDLYNEFSYGQKTPYALKNFVAKGFANWNRKPKFLLLVGDASFDPRNYLGMGDFDYLPTKLIDTDLLETASDDWFADFNDDGIPEIAVGRLSARTADEAAAQVAKIVSYKQAALNGSPGGWASNVVLVADKNDGFDFDVASNQLLDLIPDSLSVREIYRGQMDDTTARNQVIQSLNEGALLMNYLGHGSVELWRGNLLTSDDPVGLTNGTRLPLMVAMNCLNGYFNDIYTESLAEALMKAPNGGAVGVWAASGLTDAQLQLAMNEELLVQLLQYNQTIGEAIVKAKASVSDRNVRKTWIYFGDPTTRLPF
jgi:hypothetical protein